MSVQDAEQSTEYSDDAKDKTTISQRLSQHRSNEKEISHGRVTWQNRAVDFIGWFGSSYR
jgi:hypothetical protein